MYDVYTSQASRATSAELPAAHQVMVKKYRTSEVAYVKAVGLALQCEEAAKTDDHAVRVADEFEKNPGALLTMATAAEHARRLGVDPLKLMRTTELLAMSHFLAYTHAMRSSMEAIIHDTKEKGGYCKPSSRSSGSTRPR